MKIVKCVIVLKEIILQSKNRIISEYISKDHYGCEMYSNDKKAIIAVVVTLSEMTWI